MRNLVSPAATLVSALTMSAAVHGDKPRVPAGQVPAPFELERFYGLGITEHRLDARTAVVGWRISQSWYVGQRDQKGADDGLSLVWQGQRKQVSLSLDEIRFVRRF